MVRTLSLNSFVRRADIPAENLFPKRVGSICFWWRWFCWKKIEGKQQTKWRLKKYAPMQLSPPLDIHNFYYWLSSVLINRQHAKGSSTDL
jgi:hypothetical protein